VDARGCRGLEVEGLGVSKFGCDILGVVSSGDVEGSSDASVINGDAPALGNLLIIGACGGKCDDQDMYWFVELE
jgi:hypothetical protein